MGRITLPVAVVLSTLVWAVVLVAAPEGALSFTYPFWKVVSGLVPTDFAGRVVNYVVYGITGYLLIELNNAYSIIRMRTSFHCTVYVLLVTACSFLFPLQVGNIANLCLFMGIYLLFRTYQKVQPAGYIFRSFLFIGIGSILFPQLFFYVPLFLIGAYNFKSLTARTFFAAILGLSLPYWFLWGHSYFYGQMELFYAPFIELSSFEPIDYSNIQLYQLLSGAFVILLFVIAAVHSLVNSYQDKIRVRSYLNFIILIVLGTIIYCFLQPQYIDAVFPILLTGSSLLIGHLFAVTVSKVSNLLFIVSFLLLIALAFYNLWML